MRNIISYLILLTAYLYSQSWNNTIITQINEPNLVRMNMFTNRDGNHIVMQLSGGNNSIKYYLINSQGSIIRNIILESSANGEFPDIDGNNEIVYVAYRSGNKIVVKYTTNSGQSWDSSQSTYNFSTNLCNSLDIEYFEQENSYNNGLHIVWSLRDSNPYYESYYYQFSLINGWFNFKEVTDYQNEVGGFPTVAVNYDKVLVSYNWGTQQDPVGNMAIEKTRVRYNLTWLEPQQVTLNNESSARAKVSFFGNTMYCFYYESWSDLGQWGYHLIMKSKSDIYSNWSGHTVLDQYTTNPRLLVLLEKTFNNRMNLLYYENTGTYNLVHQFYDGQNWSSKTNVYSSQYYAPQVFSFSSSSNDLYLIWKDESNSYLKLRQYDAAPLTPTNLTVTTSVGNHPKLQWTRNNEADIASYKIYKYLYADQGWFLLATVSSTTTEYEDISETVVSGPPQANEHYVYYKITAVDYKPNESSFQIL